MELAKDQIRHDKVLQAVPRRKVYMEPAKDRLWHEGNFTWSWQRTRFDMTKFCKLCHGGRFTWSQRRARQRARWRRDPLGYGIYTPPHRQSTWV